MEGFQRRVILVMHPGRPDSPIASCSPASHSVNSQVFSASSPVSLRDRWHRVVCANMFKR